MVMKSISTNTHLRPCTTSSNLHTNKRVCGKMILTKPQADIVFAAMRELNKIFGFVSCTFPCIEYGIVTVTENFDGVHISRKLPDGNVVREWFLDQREFATTYNIK